MPTPSAEFKEALSRLTEKQKEQLVLRAVRRDAELHDALRFELLPDVTLETEYEASADRIHAQFNLAVSGYALNRSLVNALRQAAREAARARRVTKSHRLEINLLLYALRLGFAQFSGQFDSPRPGFYNATARLAARVARLIPQHLHEDLWLEYEPELNQMLSHLHARDRSRELSFALPHRLSQE